MDVIKDEIQKDLSSQNRKKDHKLKVICEENEIYCK